MDLSAGNLSRWSEVLMLAQVVLLYLLTTQLAKIQSQLKLVLTSAAVASVPAAAAGVVQPQQAKPSESFRCRTCATHASSVLQELAKHLPDALSTPVPLSRRGRAPPPSASSWHASRRSTICCQTCASTVAARPRVPHLGSSATRSATQKHCTNAQPPARNCTTAP